MRVGFTVREFQTFFALAQRQDRVVTRQELYGLVWGGEMPRRDRSVDVFVRKFAQEAQRRLPGLDLHPHALRHRLSLHAGTERRLSGAEPIGSRAAPPLPATPAEAVAAARIRCPTRGNRRLETLLDAANADDQLKAWWHVAQVNAERLGMSDHSWVHIQIVVNIALRLCRLLVRRGVEPAVVVDYGMDARDAEVTIVAASLLHCVGMAIHRTDHEAYQPLHGRRQARGCWPASTTSRSAR